MKEYETADFFKKEKYKLMIAIKIGRLLFCLLLKCLQNLRYFALLNSVTN